MTPNSLKQCDRQLFDLTHNQAVALLFSDVEPPGLPHQSIPQPSGCSFWRLAAEGHVFSTVASDHFGCAVGAYTLGADLPAQQSTQLRDLVSTMVELGYAKEEELAHLPSRQAPLRWLIYAPLGLCPAFPDLVLVRGNARQLMLLSEAARAAGRFDNSPARGRPACAMVPETLASDRVVLSLGCVGNRIYTGLADHEGYLAIPGNALVATCNELPAILQANEELERFHSQRQTSTAATV